MSLKDALLKHKQQLDEMTKKSLQEAQERLEKEQDEKLQQMLAEQQRILDQSEKTKDTLKSTGTSSILHKQPKLGWFTEDMLTTGGVGYIEVEGDNGKMRKVRVSLTNESNDVILSYHIRIADGRRFSLNAKSYKDAQEIVDMLWGDGLYKVSASKI